MIKVASVYVEEMENAGCNNGNYPHVQIELSNGETLRGYTCRCGRGCSETWNLPDVGAQFGSMDELWAYIDNEPMIDAQHALDCAKIVRQWCGEQRDCKLCPFRDNEYCVLTKKFPMCWKLKEE